MSLSRWPFSPGIFALWCSSLLSGCGSGIYPVEGKVVWKDGTAAQELANGMVIFNLPEKQTSARGTIQSDGSFTLTTKNPNDGAYPGKHQVLVVEGGRKPLGGPDGSALAPGVLDSRFADPSTSDLTATVVAGNNKITLTVERSGKK